MTAPHLLVIGGSRGLGRAFATMAKELGWLVTVIARGPFAPAADGCYSCDIANVEQVSEVMATIQRERGPLRYLSFFQRFRSKGDNWDGEIATSLTATRTFLECAPGCFDVAQPCAAVLVSSVNAVYISPQLPCSYHVAKAGLCQLARFFAVSLGKSGIRVNAVCPATFIKPENENYYVQHSEAYERLAQFSPLKRMGTYREVANAIFFLLSDKASFITGQSLLVDGGTSLRWHETLNS